MSIKIRRLYFILYEIQAPTLMRFNWFQKKYGKEIDLESFLLEDDVLREKDLTIEKEHWPLIR